jgi:hypothetical protein
MYVNSRVWTPLLRYFSRIPSWVWTTNTCLTIAKWLWHKPKISHLRNEANNCTLPCTFVITSSVVTLRRLLRRAEMTKEIQTDLNTWNWQHIDCQGRGSSQALYKNATGMMQLILCYKLASVLDFKNPIPVMVMNIFLFPTVFRKLLGSSTSRNIGT